MITSTGSPGVSARGLRRLRRSIAGIDGNQRNRVADIQATAEALAERGVEFEREAHLVARLPDHDLWLAFFRDPDGNLLALMSELKRS